ncbi:PEP-CTERM sorting domain-containing protein [Piscinibacter koreensis]|uniref:PEP-CTERM sorting domain-containing protein n=1 Tax=Piscinibacter koreensis TaxID=2742824 RepID=A0A7Y6NMY9_9BURK|nr:PEP-CTERM sorting domain-containing protein [Schlegelella koreensis]
MIKRILVGCLAALAFSTQAAPISFFNVELNADAIALSDGAPGIGSQSSPPGAAPVIATAASIGTADIATAGAIADTGLLNASADVTGTGAGVSSAVGAARFFGSFVNGGWLILNLGLDPFEAVTGSGLSGVSLFARLTSGGVTLFEDIITASRTLDYYLTPGTVGTLELLLTSEASVGLGGANAGSAFASGLVTLVGTVPEPGTWLLFMLGAGTMLLVRRRA